MAEPLRLLFFGGLQAMRGETPVEGFSSTKSQALLCYLAQTGRPHFREFLLTLLWSELPEEAARNNLRSTLSNLRKTVGEHITITTQTVAFSFDAPFSTDVQMIQLALAEPGNVARLREAVDLLRGEFLEGFRVRNAPEFEDWVTAERERLRPSMLQACDMLSAAYLDRGDVPAAIEIMLRSLRLDPWRESVYRQLMLTYASRGQRDAALRQYQQCRQMLEKELGVEPASETVALAEQIEQGSFGTLEPLLPIASQQIPPARSQPALPQPSARVVGRAALLGDILTLMSRPAADDGTVSHRLVTLIGPAGVGKTRLALEAAHQMRDTFRDEVYYVSLGALHDPGLLAPTIAVAIGDGSAMDQPPLDLLRKQLADKRSLVVLDNFEQLLKAAPFVANMLSTLPGLHVLVTSQAPLRIGGEQEVVVPPLSLPPDDWRSGTLAQSQSVAQDIGQYAAVTLFVERAQQLNHRFVLTEANAPLIARICRQLDGLPLAIELAAARTRHLPLPVLADRLVHRLRVLTTGLRDAAERHQTLRAALQWSYDLLVSEEQRLFAQLSVFVGGFTLDAAEQVCDLDGSTSGTTATILDGLAGLLDRSLLRQTDGSDVPGGMAREPRIIMLETLREFAAEQLATRGEDDRLRERHARYYLQLAQAAQRDAADPEEMAGLKLLGVEHPNFRSALRWASTPAPGESERLALGLRMIAALGRFWLIRGYHQEGEEWLQRFLALGHDDDPAVVEARAQALVAGAWIAHARDDFAQASAMFEEAARISGDDQAHLDMLVNAAMEARAVGDYARATALLEESLRRCLAQGDRTVIGRGGLGLTLARLGLVLCEQGAYEDAVARWNECLALHRSLDDPRGIAVALLGLGDVARYRGNTTLVYRRCEESRKLFTELGDRANVAFALNNMALAAAEDGDLATASTYAAECVELLGALKTGSALAEGLATQGYIHLLMNEFAAAHTALVQSLAQALQYGPRWLVAVDLECLAEWLHRQAPGDTVAEHSARMLGTAQRLREEIGAPVPPIRRGSLALLEQELRATLGARFAVLLADGAAMTPEQVAQLLF